MSSAGEYEDVRTNVGCSKHAVPIKPVNMHMEKRRNEIRVDHSSL
jgi:hypothetical protein